MKTLVTGASSPLGKRICEFLNKKGYQVIVTAHNTPIEEAYKTIKTDLTSASGVQALCENLVNEKSLDLLVNCFGPLLVKPLLETTQQELISQYQATFFTPYSLMQKLYPLLEKKGGSIINLGLCGLNHSKVSTYYPVYKSAKHSLLYLTKCFAKELIEKNVRVNMISPGYLEHSIDLPKSDLPQKRLVQLEEILSAIDFLLDTKNLSITGQNIEIAGGVGL